MLLVFDDQEGEAVSLSEQQKREYLLSNGTMCPVCKSEDIGPGDGTEMEEDGTYLELQRL